MSMSCPKITRRISSTDNTNLIKVIFIIGSHLLNISHAVNVKRGLMAPGNSFLGNQSFVILLDTFSENKQTFSVFQL